VTVSIQYSLSFLIHMHFLSAASEHFPEWHAFEAGEIFETDGVLLTVFHVGTSH
jgi:hypothetical protein